MIEYYGDDNRWFIGRVVSIGDPLELGRVRVRIFGIHSGNMDDIPEADLPWAQVVVPITEGGSSGLGTNVGIKEQAQVYGIFLDGKNSQLPLVLGSIPKFESVAGPRGYSRKQSESRGAPDLSGATNAEKAYNWFLSKEGGDFTPEQAAGIIGNLLKESQEGGDINPLAENENEGSFGIAQWNPAAVAGNRLGKLKAFAKQNQLNYRDLYTQLAFITHELYTTEGDALEKVKASRSAEEAALAFEWFERPEGWSRTSRSITAGDRIAFAEDMLYKMEVA